MRAAMIMLVAALGPGCISTGSFNSARTVDPGEVRHTMGLSMFVVQRAGDTILVPLPMPLYGISYGLAEGFEGSAQVSLPGRLRFEGKYNPIRTEYFDLAIAPALYVALFPSTKGADDTMWLFGAELPLIADLNVTRTTSFVGWFGPAFAGAPTVGRALYLRTGGGLQWRGDGYSVQPEISFAYDPARRTVIDVSFGVGFTYGALPSFGGSSDGAY